MTLIRYQFSCSGTPEQPGSAVPRLSYIATDRFSTDWSSELHTHGCAELFFILDGHGYFRTLYEEFPISVQDLLIVNANVPHTEVSSMKSPLRYIVLGVEGLKAAASDEGHAMFHIYDGWTELNNCLELMLQEVHGARPGHEEICRNLLEVVLIRLSRQEDLSLTDESPDLRVSRECGLVRRYIDNHFKENLSLDQLARLPLNLPRREIVQEEISSWFAGQGPKLQALHYHSLLTNSLPLAQAGDAYPLCVEGAYTIRPTPGLTFVPIAPERAVGHVLAWKKNRLFSRATDRFIRFFMEYISGMEDADEEAS